MKFIALDLEIIHDIGSPYDPTSGVFVGKYSWDRPWELGVAVACTFSPEEGFRDWFGGYEHPDWESPDIEAMLEYLKGFDRIIGFNTMAFDFRVLDGYLDFESWKEGQRVPAPEPVCACELVEKSVDMLMDIRSVTGKRVSLDAVMKGEMNIEKSEDSARLPGMWRAGKRLEVIENCREHTKATYDIWDAGNQGGGVRYQYPDMFESRFVKVAWVTR